MYLISVGARDESGREWKSVVASKVPEEQINTPDFLNKIRRLLFMTENRKFTIFDFILQTLSTSNSILSIFIKL